jgi:hypothetical protein
LEADFDESVNYSFNFQPDGTYRMLWARSFGVCGIWSEQHFGAWRIVLDQVICETLDPRETPKEEEVPYAAAGFEFQLPLDAILNADGAYFTAPPRSPAAPWEITARTGKREGTK